MYIPENILQLDDKLLSRRREWVSHCRLMPVSNISATV